MALKSLMMKIAMALAAGVSSAAAAQTAPDQPPQHTTAPPPIGRSEADYYG